MAYLRFSTTSSSAFQPLLKRRLVVVFLRGLKPRALAYVVALVFAEVEMACCAEVIAGSTDAIGTQLVSNPAYISNL
jgi:hypothetical protein